MKWSPEPLGTTVRARTRGYRPTFYRGWVRFAAAPVRNLAIDHRDDAMLQRCAGWSVRGSLLEELLRGEPRKRSEHRSDVLRGDRTVRAITHRSFDPYSIVTTTSTRTQAITGD